MSPETCGCTFVNFSCIKIVIFGSSPDSLGWSLGVWHFLVFLVVTKTWRNCHLSPCCNTDNHILEDHTVEDYSVNFISLSLSPPPICRQKNIWLVVIILSWTQEDASGGCPDCFHIPVVADWPFFLLQFMRCFENHQVVAFEELRNSHEAIPIHKPIFCDVHPAENMKFFCLSCQVIRYNVNGARLSCKLLYCRTVEQEIYIVFVCAICWPEKYMLTVLCINFMNI